MTCDLSRFILSLAYVNTQRENPEWLTALLGTRTDWPTLALTVTDLAPARVLVVLQAQEAGSVVLQDYGADSESSGLRPGPQQQFRAGPW